MQKIKLPLDLFHKDKFVIVRVLSGTYVCPGWHKVPPDTTRDQIEFDMTVIPSKRKVVTDETKTNDIEVKVKSSKGDKTYTVSYKSGIWNCTCPAKSFRRGDCKHIIKIKNKK